MKILHVLTAAALASAAIAGCDRPGTQVAANAPVSGMAPPASAVASTPVTGTQSNNVVTDTLVTGKVKTAITADNAMKDADISVKTENGVVTLTGTVRSSDQVTLASALAQRQEGVSRVENQVAVR